MNFFQFMKGIHSKANNNEEKFNFLEIPKEEWKSFPKWLLRVFKSSKFLVQIYEDRKFLRITVNKVENLGSDFEPVWKSGITWDELQSIKNALGYYDQWCVECYPPADECVNVANLRHLWVLEKPPEFGWHYENYARDIKNYDRKDKF